RPRAGCDAARRRSPVSSKSADSPRSSRLPSRRPRWSRRARGAPRTRCAPSIGTATCSRCAPTSPPRSRASPPPGCPGSRRSGSTTAGAWSANRRPDPASRASACRPAASWWARRDRKRTPRCWRPPRRRRSRWASPRAPGPAASSALQRLTGVLELAQARNLGAELEVDLGEVRGLGYYTGLVFNLYAAGAPRAVGGGGRYDTLLGRFGDPRPAVGFSLDLDALVPLARPA